uniref:Uncharacterized protein n=1 Tax=Moniliophthora roreri TaxID=221103 RepID=A0A0W0FTN0_MONRR
MKTQLILGSKQSTNPQTKPRL